MLMVRTQCDARSTCTLWFGACAPADALCFVGMRARVQLTALKTEMAIRKSGGSSLAGSPPSTKSLQATATQPASWHAPPLAAARSASLPAAPPGTPMHHTLSMSPLPPPASPRSSSFAAPASGNLLAAVAAASRAGAPLPAVPGGSPTQAAQAARLAELQAKAFQLLAGMDRQAASSAPSPATAAALAPGPAGPALPSPATSHLGGTPPRLAAAAAHGAQGAGLDAAGAKMEDIKARALQLLQQQARSPRAAAGSSRATQAPAPPAASSPQDGGGMRGAGGPGGTGKSPAAAAARLEELQAKALQLMAARCAVGWVAKEALAGCCHALCTALP